MYQQIGLHALDTVHMGLPGFVLGRAHSRGESSFMEDNIAWSPFLG
jgi:hypothetical protein